MRINPVASNNHSCKQYTSFGSIVQKPEQILLDNVLHDFHSVRDFFADSVPYDSKERKEMFNLLKQKASGEIFFNQGDILLEPKEYEEAMALYPEESIQKLKDNINTYKTGRPKGEFENRKKQIKSLEAPFCKKLKEFMSKAVVVSNETYNKMIEELGNLEKDVLENVNKGV